MSNGYFQSPCRKRLVTRASDLDANDLKLTVTAEPGEEEGTFDISAVLAPKPNFGDIQGFDTAGNASIYDEVGSETAVGTDAGPNTAGTPETLELLFQGVEQTESNVGNTWQLVIANLQVTTKDGATHTIPSLVKTFPSPL